MIVSKDFIAGVRTGFKATFDQLLSKQPSLWAKVATLLPADSKEIIQFNWLGTPPMPRLFKDELEFGKSFPHDYQVVITDYAVGLRIKKNEFRRDPLGTIALHMKNFMVQAMKYKDFLIFTQMTSGFTANGFDAVTFYNASHSIGDGSSWNNLGTAQLSAIDPAAYNTGYAQIQTAVDDHDQPLGLTPSALVHHPLKRYTVMQLLKASIIEHTTNVLAGDVEPISSPWLNGNNEWHLIDGSAVIKPFLLVVDEDWTFVAMDGMTDPAGFIRHAFEYQIFGSMTTGFGDPRTAYASLGEG